MLHTHVLYFKIQKFDGKKIYEAIFILYFHCNILKKHLPTLLRISNTLHVVLLEITDLPAKSCALTPSPAVILSLLRRTQCPGIAGISYTCLVFPSIINSPNL